jgi:sugar phosphate isomerase/epimerase
MRRRIRWLGRERICQFHLKDKGYLGEGKVSYPDILAAIDAIGFKGYGVFETSAPSKDIDADLLRNVKFVERLMS